MADHELFLNLAEALQARLELQVVVGGCLSNGRDDGNPVALGADIVCRRDASDVNVWVGHVSQTASVLFD